MSLHVLYEQLSDDERELVDDVMRFAYHEARGGDEAVPSLRSATSNTDGDRDPIPLAGDDRAEHVAECLAWWIVASRPSTRTSNALPLLPSRPDARSGPEIVAERSTSDAREILYRVNPRANERDQLVSSVRVVHRSEKNVEASGIVVYHRGDRAGVLAVDAARDRAALAARLLDTNVDGLHDALVRAERDAVALLDDDENSDPG